MTFNLWEECLPDNGCIIAGCKDISAHVRPHL